MLTAQQIFDLIKCGDIVGQVTKETKAFIFYRVDFRGMPETIRVPKGI